MVNVKLNKLTLLNRKALKQKLVFCYEAAFCYFDFNSVFFNACNDVYE